MKDTSRLEKLRKKYVGPLYDKGHASMFPVHNIHIKCVCVLNFAYC